MWDPLTRYENLRLLAEEGSRGSPRVPLLILLGARFGTVIEEPTNLGYHFSGHFDLLQRVRDVTISVYPERVVVALGSHADPLRFWELFVFLTGWLPGVTGLPIQAWQLRQMELNRDHLLEEGVGPIWAMSRSMTLVEAVTAMVKVYTRHEVETTARAEVRLSGDIAKEVLMDDVRAMMEYSERLDR